MHFFGKSAHHPISFKLCIKMFDVYQFVIWFNKLFILFIYLSFWTLKIHGIKKSIPVNTVLSSNISIIVTSTAVIMYKI